jgi:hypothetical protein
MKYIITGEPDEVIHLATQAREEGRFMSDSKNLDGFKWYPITENTHVLEVWTDSDEVIDTRELAILTREYTSLTIGIVKGELVSTVVAEGEVEQLD